MALRINRRLGEFAHQMRRQPTEPEKRLWRHLSASKLGGFKLRRQTVIENVICDFSCSWNGLIIELDGDTHDGDADRIRDARLHKLGYHVMRVTNHDVMTNIEGVLAAILVKCETLPERRYSPTPTPPFQGRASCYSHRTTSKSCP